MGTDARLTITADGGDARREVEALRRELERLGRASASPRVDVDPSGRGRRNLGHLTAGVGSFNQGLTRANDGVSALGRSLGRFSTRTFTYGMVGATAATAGLIGVVAKTGVQFNTMKENAELAFTTMLGSGKQARTFLGELQAFAAKTPFEFPDLVMGSQRLLAMGFSAKQVLPVMTAVGDATAGLGGSPEKLNRIITAMGQIQAKGRATAEEIMQLTEAGIPAWDMLARKLGVDVPTAMDMVTKRAVSSDVAIAALQEGMVQRFGGLMEKQAKTTAGLWSTLKDTFAIRSAELMEPLMPSIKRAISGMTSALNSPQATAGIDRFGRALGALTEDLAAIAGMDIDLDRKLAMAFRRIDETGVPDAVKDAIGQGIIGAATAGPRLFVDAFMAAPWPAKAVIAALLVNRFAPALTLAGRGLATAAARAGSGAAAGGLAARALSTVPGVPRGVQPVWVVNGGAGGVDLGRAGRFGGLAALARNPFARAGGIAGLGIAAGMGLDSLQQGGHLEGIPGVRSLFPSPAQTRRSAAAALAAYIEVWRDGGDRLAEDTVLGDRGFGRLLASQARDAVGGFVRGLDAARPSVRRSAEGITAVAVDALQGLGPRSRALAADTMIRYAGELERQGRAPKGTVSRMVRDIEQEFGRLPAATRRMAQFIQQYAGRIAPALRNGVGQGARDAAAGLTTLADQAARLDAGRITAYAFAIQQLGRSAAGAAGAFRGLANDAERIARADRQSQALGTGDPLAGFSTGGRTSGPYTGRDDRLAALAGDEVILRPYQQMLVPGGRTLLDNVLRHTGGRIGARGFASGGWVHPAPGTRRGGGPGGGTHSYSSPPNNWQSDTAWDLMGADGTPVVATHAGTITATRPFSSDPRFWGHAAYLSVPGGQFYYKHLKSLSVRPGQKVQAGDVIGVLGTGVNGGPHLHLGADSRSLLDKAVNAPPGRKGGEDGHETPEDEQTPARIRREDTAALRRAGVRGPGRLAGVVSATNTGAYDPSAAAEAATGTVQAAGERDARRARLDSLKANRDLPEPIREALAEDAERNAQRASLRRARTVATGRLQRVRAQASRIERELARKRPKGKRLPAATRKRMASAARALRQEARDIAAHLDDLNLSLRELGEQQFRDFAPTPREDTGPDTPTLDAAQAFAAGVQADDNLQDYEARRGAESQAERDLGPNANPEEVRLRGDRAVVQARLADAEKIASHVATAHQHVRNRIAFLRGEWAKQYALLRRLKASQRQLRAKVLKAIQAIRDELDDREGEEAALAAQHADIQAEVQRLGGDLALLDRQIQDTPDTIQPEAGTAGGSGVSPEQEARNQARDEALRNAESFIATSLGPGDLASGLRPSALGSAVAGDGGTPVVVVNVQTLHPGDPETLAAVGQVVVGALGAQGAVPATTSPAGI